jgi:Arc/MetJ family transcription regulator
MAIRKTSLDIDEELLDKVRGILGTRTLKETVEEAFREIVRDRARREEVEALASMEGMDLDDPEVMAGAWRP